ncbi:MAG: hypothetical protein O9341_25150 [Paucibacter sp.]|nr:hypothetical protein [Roseateles sp.]
MNCIKKNNDTALGAAAVISSLAVGDRPVEVLAARELRGTGRKAVSLRSYRYG